MSKKAESFVYSCECGNEFNDLQSLSFHLQERHNAVLVQDESDIGCEIEKKTQENILDIKAETDVSTVYNEVTVYETNSCNERSCKLSPSTEQLLKDHFCKHSNMQHDDEINFCETCRKMFLSKKTFVSHCLEKHTGRKQFFGGRRQHKLPSTCYFCGHTFCSRRLLYQHQIKHPGIKMFICPVCLERFIDRTDLREHFRKHVGNYEFTCGPEVNQARIINMYLKMVDQTLPDKSAKKRKKFNCTICTESFTESEELLLHKNVVHTDKNVDPIH